MKYCLTPLTRVEQTMPDNIIKDCALANISVSDGNQVIYNIFECFFESLCQHGATRQPECLVHSLNCNECLLNLCLSLIHWEHLLTDEVTSLEAPMAGETMALWTFPILNWVGGWSWLDSREIMLLKADPEVIFSIARYIFFYLFRCGLYEFSKVPVHIWLLSYSQINFLYLLKFEPWYDLQWLVVEDPPIRVTH